MRAGECARGARVVSGCTGRWLRGEPSCRDLWWMVSTGVGCPLITEMASVWRGVKYFSAAALESSIDWRTDADSTEYTLTLNHLGCHLMDLILPMKTIHSITGAWKIGFLDGSTFDCADHGRYCTYHFSWSYEHLEPMRFSSYCWPIGLVLDDYGHEHFLHKQLWASLWCDARSP